MKMGSRRHIITKTIPQITSPSGGQVTILIMFSKKDIELIIFDALKERIGKDLVDNWKSPLKEPIKEIVESKTPEIKQLLNDSLDSVLNNKSFRALVKEEFDRKVAKLLIAQLSGEIEKSVNAYKQSPELRARMTLAIENIVKDFEQAPTNNINP